jgi:hypothetical protein
LAETAVFITTGLQFIVIYSCSWSAAAAVQLLWKAKGRIANCSSDLTATDFEEIIEITLLQRETYLMMFDDGSKCGLWAVMLDLL